MGIHSVVEKPKLIKMDVDTTQCVTTSNDNRLPCSNLRTINLETSKFSNYDDILLNEDDEQMLDLNMVVFDSKKLSADIVQIKHDVATVRNAILSSLDDLEQDLKNRVELGMIPEDVKLFNKLSSIIPKVNNLKKAVKYWYSNFLSDCNDLQSEISRYRTVIQSIDDVIYNLKQSNREFRSSRIGLIDNSIVTRARNNITRSKSLSKARNRLTALNTIINKKHQRLITRLQDLDTGILHYDIQGNDKEFDIHEVLESIRSLTESNSPLEILNQNVARQIANTPTVSHFITDNIETIKMPESGTTHFERDARNNLLSDDEVIAKLKNLAKTRLYTTGTQILLENLKDQLDKRYANNETKLKEIETLFGDIRKRVPATVLAHYRALSVSNNDTAQTLKEVKELYKNLSPEDAIYADELRSIIRQTRNTIKKQIMADAGNIQPTDSNLSTELNNNPSTRSPRPPPPPPGAGGSGGSFSNNGNGGNNNDDRGGGGMDIDTTPSSQQVQTPRSPSPNVSSLSNIGSVNGSSLAPTIIGGDGAESTPAIASTSRAAAETEAIRRLGRNTDIRDYLIRTQPLTAPSPSVIVNEPPPNPIINLLDEDDSMNAMEQQLPPLQPQQQPPQPTPANPNNQNIDALLFN